MSHASSFVIFIRKVNVELDSSMRIQEKEATRDRERSLGKRQGEKRKPGIETAKRRKSGEKKVGVLENRKYLLSITLSTTYCEIYSVLFGISNVSENNKPNILAELSRGAPWGRKSGKPYTERPTDRPSAPQVYQRKISSSLW